MKAIKVQYKVQTGYVETNKKNIQAVMDELARNPIEGMWYKAFLLEDGQTFMHLNLSNGDEVTNKLNDLEQFNKFRRELKASEPISSPKVENLKLIAGNE